MKKLFSIVLVIAMAVSCLAIFPSAVTTGECTWTHEIVGDVVTFTLWADAWSDMPVGVNPFFEMYWDDPACALQFMGEEYVVLEGADMSPEGGAAVGWDVPEDCSYFYFGVKPMKWVVDQATGDLDLTVKVSFKIVGAEPGDTIELTNCDIMMGAARPHDLRPIELNSTYSFVYEETAVEEPEDTTTEAPVVPEEPELPEAPAVAEYQELAGCEVCGVKAGVRFKATVSGDTDNFGMKITGNNRTFDLNSKSNGFKSVETDNGIEFTAVIFTTDVDFTVVVYETYAEGTVESAGTTNA